MATPDFGKRRLAERLAPLTVALILSIVTALATSQVLASGGVQGPICAGKVGYLCVVAGSPNRGGPPMPGPATGSFLDNPIGVTVDDAGNLYIADAFNYLVEKVAPSGRLAVVAGDGQYGAPTPGPATRSHLDPRGVAVDANGNLFIADGDNHVVEKVTPSGTLSVVAGTGESGPPTPGPATRSDVEPGGIAVDANGNIYIADGGNSVVEKVTPSGTLSIVAGTGEPGAPTPGPAISSDVEPDGIAVDANGNLYISDDGNYVVEKVAPSGTLSLVAGTGERGAPTAGPATGSDIEPYGIAVDGDGNLYIADYDNCMVEKVSPTGTLSVVAGTGSLTRGVPTPGPATRSALYYPLGVGVDGAGNLYIADSANEVVEEVTMAAPTPSTVVIPSPSASASPSPAAAVPASTVPLVPLSALPLLVVVGVAILVLIGLLFLLLSPLQGQAPGTAVGPPAERAPPAVTPPSRFASWVGNATRVLLLLEACAIPFVAFFEYEGIWLGAVFAGIGLPTPVIAGPLAGLSLGGLLVACAVNLKRQRWAWIAALIVQMYLVLIGLLWRPVLILPTPCLVLLLLPGVRSAPARDARSADDRYPALPPWLESPPRVSAGPLPSGGPRRGARAWGIGCGATPVILAIVAWLLSTAYFNIHRPVFVGLEIGMLLAYPVTLALVVTVGRRRLRAMVRRLGLGVVAVAVLSCVAFLTSLAGLYALAFPHGLTVAEVEATPEYQLHYPGATPTGTTVQPYSPGVTSFDGPTVSYYDPPEATLSFQAPAPVTKVATWYSTRLASLGWSYAGCVAKASPWVDEYFTSGGDSMFELQISATYPQGSSITVDITLQQPIQGYLPQGLVVSCPSS